MARPGIVVCFIAMLLGIAAPVWAAECPPPEAIEAYESGKAHLDSGQIEKGVAEIERAVALYPDFADAWFDLYETYNRANRVDKVIVALEHLVRIQPGADIWRGLLALHRADAAIPPAAMEALNRCRSLKPGSKAAIAECEKALSLHSDYADARYFLGINYIYAGDEESAKEQLAALVMIDTTMAGMLAHSMEVMTNWLTAEYKQELEALFATTPAPAESEAPTEYPPTQFSDDDVARILVAYEEQIDALRDLMADPKLIPEGCGTQAPTELMNHLKEKLIPLSFVRVERSPTPDCRHGLGYLLFDARDPGDRQRGLTEVVKVAKNLGIGDPDREHWRVGLHQEWVTENYCKEECTARLEFRIDKEIDGQTVNFKAWIGIQRDINDIAQCSSYYGETRDLKEW